MILAAGMSPAWQQILEFEAVRVGAVNRARSATWCASGKVLNVARALERLGAPARTICSVGGASGRAIRDEFERDGIAAEWIESGAATRICTTLLDRSSGETTELVENAAACRPQVFEQFVGAYAAAAPECEYAILTGSLPPNAPSGLTRRLLESSNTPVLLDIRGPELLDVLPLRPFVVKPNRQELAQTIGRELSDDGDLLNAMRELNDRGAEWVVVTDGGRALWVTSSDESCRIQPPGVEAVNPIGCGDCLTAGLSAALLRKRPFVEALKWGVAVAAANAERLLPAEFEAARATELFTSVVVDKV